MTSKQAQAAVASKTVQSTPVANVASELPDAPEKRTEQRMSVEDAMAFFATPEEFVTFPAMRAVYSTNNKGKPCFLVFHNGAQAEVYPAADAEFPDGLVQGARGQLTVTVRKHDGVRYRDVDGRRYMTLFATSVAFA